MNNNAIKTTTFLTGSAEVKNAGIKYAIYKRFGGFEVTSLDNYRAGITDESKVMEFKHKDGFELIFDVIDYMVKYCYAKVDDFVVK